MKANKKDKKPFEFSYTMPSLDWFETINVKINPEDYYYFRLERRFGPSWWLIGSNPVDKPSYHWEDKELGQLGFDGRDDEVKRFIEWTKTDNGSKIIEIQAISGSFDIFRDIDNIFSGERKKQIINQNKAIRKQVCDEIREKLKENGLLYTWKGEPKYKTMEELLDQIEKGVDNDK